MTCEQAKSELMQIYMSLSEEKKKALDVAFKAMEQAQNCDQCEVGNACLYCEYEFKAQADGEKSFKMRDATPEEQEAVDKYIKSISKPTGVNFWEMLKRMPAMAIPPEHDGCKDCKHQNKNNFEMPCFKCKQNYKDMWEMEKPTDTITMTREEFSEKLMEHYRQGRADEKAYQNGEIMQSFNPD